MRQEFAIAESENETTTVERPPSIGNSVFFLIDAAFKIKSVDVILHKSSKTDNLESSAKFIHALTGKKLADPDLHDCGIWISIQQTSVNISCEEGKLEVCSDILETRCIIFRYGSQKGKTTDNSLLLDRLLESLNCLYEISLTSCKSTLSLLLPQSASSLSSLTNKLGDSTSGGNKYTDNFSLPTDSESLSGQSSFVQEIEVAPNIVAPVSSHWLHVNVVLNVIYMGRCSGKNTVVGARDSNKLLSSLSVGGELHAISWEIQVVLV